MEGTEKRRLQPLGRWAAQVATTGNTGKVDSRVNRVYSHDGESFDSPIRERGKDAGQSSSKAITVQTTVMTKRANRKQTSARRSSERRRVRVRERRLA
jgi:hypothetical protein